METDVTNSEKIRNRVNYQTAKSVELGDISTSSENLIPDPIERLKQAEYPTLSELTEAILYWCQKTYGQELIVSAHTNFQDKTGVVFPEDSHYHERMGYFLDYLIFQHKTENDVSIYSQFMDSSYLAQAKLPEASNTAFCSLSNNNHSIFMVAKATSKKLIIKDLFAKTKIEVLGQGLEFFQLIKSPIVFQGFAFKIGDEVHLSKGIIQHDLKANRQILKNIKIISKNSSANTDDELFLLAKQGLSMFRLKNIGVKKAYQRA